MRKSKIYMKLGGGLGNQLFQYSAALILATEKNKKIVFDISNLRTAHHGSKSLITHLSISGNFSSSRLVSTLLKIMRKLSLHFPLIQRFYRVFIADKLGFVDFKSLDLRHLRILEGFFISSRYLSELKTLGVLNAVEPRQPTRWFLELKKVLNSREICAIHVRQGDYLNSFNHYGVLSENYYRQAIDLINASYSPEEFWIFTDSPAAAETIFSRMSFLNYRIISPPDGSPDAESLLLMSKCGAIITANSTFSFWSAYLSKSSNIVAPYPLYRRESFESDLYMDSWKIVKSDWIDLDET